MVAGIHLWHLNNTTQTKIKLRQHTGIRNAKVFPEPVLAAPKTSQPFKDIGIPAFWISVGSRYPAPCKPGEIKYHSLLEKKTACSRNTLMVHVNYTSLWIMQHKFILYMYIRGGCDRKIDRGYKEVVTSPNLSLEKKMWLQKTDFSCCRLESHSRKCPYPPHGGSVES